MDDLIRGISGTPEESCWLSNLIVLFALKVASNAGSMMVSTLR